MSIRVPSPVVPYVPASQTLPEIPADIPAQNPGAVEKTVPDELTERMDDEYDDYPSYYEYEDEEYNGPIDSVPQSGSDLLSAAIQPPKVKSLSSADFDDFVELKDADEEAEKRRRRKEERERRKKIEAYTETDRIDDPNQPLVFDLKVGASMGGGQAQGQGQTGGKIRIAVGSVGGPEPAYAPDLRIDPLSVTYTANSKPYGQQYPSYVPSSLVTTLGTEVDGEKRFAVGSDVVYGRADAGSTGRAEGVLGEVEVEYYDDLLAGEYEEYEDEYESEPRSMDSDTLQALKVKLELEDMSDGDFIELIKRLELEDEEEK